MRLITPTPDRVTATPNAVMTGLAAPSAGSTELSTWRVSMEPGASGPEHSIDREQVWMPVTGSLTITVDGHASAVGAGEAAILPAGVLRQISTPDGPVDAVVCMRSGGVATIPGEPEPRQLPWTL